MTERVEELEQKLGNISGSATDLVIGHLNLESRVERLEAQMAKVHHLEKTMEQMVVKRMEEMEKRVEKRVEEMEEKNAEEQLALQLYVCNLFNYLAYHQTMFNILNSSTAKSPGLCIVWPVMITNLRWH